MLYALGIIQILFGGVAVYASTLMFGDIAVAAGIGAVASILSGISSIITGFKTRYD